MEQLGLSYVAAVVRTAGFSVEILDGFLEPERYNNLLQTIDQDDYNLIGYPVYQENVKRVARDCKMIRSRGIFTHITVGNYLATLGSEDVLREFDVFDSAVRGEGEQSCLELLTVIIGGKDLNSVLGLTFRSRGSIHSNTARPNRQILDELPFPARDTLPLVIKAGNAPLIYSSRGCNARCDFCSVHTFYNSSPNGAWRARTPKNIVDEMESLHREFNVREFAFADEQFMGHGRPGQLRATGIARELIQRECGYRWYIETRSSEVVRDTFEVLAEGGLSAVYMGLESGSEIALREMRKGLHAQQHLEAIRILKDLEILVSIGFIMFRPTTTIAELHENLNFLELVGAGEIVHLASFTKIYAGAPLQIKMENAGALGGTVSGYNWEFADEKVSVCFEVMKSATASLSVAFNSYAELRRTGLMSYAELQNLQQHMNGIFIAAMRELVCEVDSSILLKEDRKSFYENLFVEKCSEFLSVLRLIEVMASNRPIDGGVRLLNPMALC